MLSSVQRDGCHVEKWEFYTGDYNAIPFLALIPDGASKANPVPGVMCYPGTVTGKERLAGEPEINHPNCVQRMAMDQGVHACVVGTAITRPMEKPQHYVKVLK